MLQTSQGLVTPVVQQLGPIIAALPSVQQTLFFSEIGMAFFFLISNSSCRGSVITCGVTVSLNQLKQMRVGKAWLSSAAAGRLCRQQGPNPARGCPRRAPLCPDSPRGGLACPCWILFHSCHSWSILLQFLTSA